MAAQNAESVRTMTTYKRGDGGLVAGEYSFVTDLEYFEEDDPYEQYFEVIEERWQLVEARTLKFGDTDRWCANCEDDLRLREPVAGPVWCEACKAKGAHLDGTSE